MNPVLWNTVNRVYTQTTDGTNDYYVGIDGTNGFAIAPFQGISTMTFHALINFPSTINSASTATRVLEISDTSRTNIYGIDIGAYTGALTNEYIGTFTNLAGAVRSTGCTDGGSITAGWHTVMVKVSAGTVVIAIDGVGKTLTNSAGGAPLTISSGYTATRLGLMAGTNGVIPTGCTFRDVALLSSSLTAANALDLYKYYTKDGNITLAESDRSIWKYMAGSSSYASILGLWQGNESGTNLLGKKSSARNLTKTNF